MLLSTETPLGDQIARLLAAAPRAAACERLPIFSLHALIYAILARIFARLEQILLLWQAGALPTPKLRPTVASMPRDVPNPSEPASRPDASRPDPPRISLRQQPRRPPRRPSRCPKLAPKYPHPRPAGGPNSARAKPGAQRRPIPDAPHAARRAPRQPGRCPRSTRSIFDSAYSNFPYQDRKRSSAPLLLRYRIIPSN